MDKISAERRSANMSAIRSKDTAPELVVRRTAHRMGYRYRLHVNSLPGKPDLVFPSRLRAIFVHGCFWHQHPTTKCADARCPSSNLRYWQPKLARNVARDLENTNRLKENGWRVLVIWDCETKNERQLAARLRRFLEE